MRKLLFWVSTSVTASGWIILLIAGGWELLIVGATIAVSAVVAMGCQVSIQKKKRRKVKDEQAGKDIQ